MLGVRVSILSTLKATFQEKQWHKSSCLEKWIIPFNGDVDLLSSKFSNILGDIDIAHFHGVLNYKYALIAIRLALKNIPYIITPHGQIQSDAIRYHTIKKKTVIKTILRPLLMNASAIHIFSESEKRRLYPCFSKTAERHVVPNGIVVNQPISQDIELKNTLLRLRRSCRRVFCYAGRLDINHKGIDLFSDAVISAKKQLVDGGVKIWLVGNYLSERDEILINEKLNKASELIEYWGMRSLEEKNLIVSKSDIFFHTSRYEGMPLAVLEAMQMGLPVLVTEGTNMREIVERSRGGWVVPNKVEAIKEALIKTVAFDSTFLKYTGEHGRKYVYKHMSWGNISQQIFNMYQEVIEKRS
jgi:glycosyltransferase involved in cell wall biosynthesis